jgi:hypothetical protein
VEINRRNSFVRKVLLPIALAAFALGLAVTPQIEA